MGRWQADEEAALAELKEVLKVELDAAPQFPGSSHFLCVLIKRFWLLEDSWTSKYQDRTNHLLVI